MRKMEKLRDVVEGFRTLIYRRRGVAHETQQVPPTTVELKPRVHLLAIRRSSAHCVHPILIPQFSPNRAARIFKSGSTLVGRHLRRGDLSPKVLIRL
jgi:hypothetical protein